MFSHSCSGTNIFIWWKMKCTIQLGFASMNGTFHLSPHENSYHCTHKHSLFASYTIWQDRNPHHTHLLKLHLCMQYGVRLFIWLTVHFISMIPYVIHVFGHVFFCKACHFCLHCKCTVNLLTYVTCSDKPLDKGHLWHFQLLISSVLLQTKL